MPPSLSDAIQSYQAGGATAQLGADFGKVQPFISSVSAPSTGANFDPGTFKTNAAAANPGIISSFGHFASGVMGEAGHLFAATAKWVGKTAVNAIEAPINLGDSLIHAPTDMYNANMNAQQQGELQTRLTSLVQQFRAGQISSTQYQAEMKQWQSDSNSLTKNLQDNQKALTHDSSQLVTGSIGTASDILTVMTAGLTAPLSIGIGEQAAAKYLQSSLVDAALTPAEASIAKIAGSKAVYDALPSAVQRSVATAFTDTATTAIAGRTSAQIARATATNLLLKYPLAYSALNGTGNQVYQELQKGKYGDAVKTLAFNAALLLSGGPIGQAMRYGGRAISNISAKTFGATSFFDELGKRIGDGNAANLYNAVKDNPEAIQAFKSMEATNLAATDGKPITAAVRVIEGLQQSWGDMSNLSHEDFVKQVMNWHVAQGLVDDFAKTTGQSGIAVGRFTAADNNRIAATLTGGTPGDTKGMLQRWESFKASNSNAAFANNENLDQQVKNVIKNNKADPTLVDRGIRNIDAQNAVAGVPKSLGNKLAKMGYVVIKPVNLEAPFKEGEGRLATSFHTPMMRHGSELPSPFIKTVQPLPVLSSVGNTLTRMGLSPTAAGQRVYDVFNANFAEALRGTEFAGANISDNMLKDRADTVAKDLANYVHNLGSGGFKHPPITDYRQMTIKEISQATGANEHYAKEIADSIQQAMLQVPVSVKGLGNKLLDTAYNIPVTGKYLRYQGALRYAWNPFFKMKLATKGEILSQLESKGQVPTIAGMNGILKTVFPEQYKQLPAIEQALRSKGMFGSGYGAEAADETAAGYSQMATKGVGGDAGHLVASQRRAVSALVGTMAKKSGMEPADFIDNFPQQTRDAIQTVLHYDPRSDFMNSPMARTLNYAFFPFRFNIKVSQIIARNLSKQDAMTQYAVIKGFMNASTFLQSNEGQAWYSQNSDIINLLKYFSPVATISEVAQALGQRPHSVSQYGELGGLPFGWIPAMLSSQGLIDTNQVYVSPKTGVIAKDYVPVNSRGRLEAAIEDFLGQMFTYPGTQVGLPSKTKATVDIAKSLVGGKTGDFQTVTPNLTPQQQQFQSAVQQLNGGLQQVRQQVPTPGQVTTPTMVPAQPVPNVPPKFKSGSAGTAKRKKSQYTPQLLPGQTTLGQIPQ